ncbi:MAG: ribonuclease HI [Chloroflexota bacterium]
MSDRPSGPVAYTDGGCIGNPGPGGWGVHLEYPDGRVVELGGSELQTTNNRMELRAAIEAARAVGGWPAATIVTDSQYVRRGITGWLAGWKRKGWVTAAGQPVLNRDLWEELDAASGPQIAWEWTRGHSGDPGNERCDEIASWFSASVAPLARGRRRSTNGNGNGTNGKVSNGSGSNRTPLPHLTPFGTVYLSVVDGIPARHATWAECEQRVKGVKSARFKKVKSQAEEREVFAKWGVTDDDLFGI